MYAILRLRLQKIKTVFVGAVTTDHPSQTIVHPPLYQQGVTVAVQIGVMLYFTAKNNRNLKFVTAALALVYMLFNVTLPSLLPRRLRCFCVFLCAFACFCVFCACVCMFFFVFFAVSSWLAVSPLAVSHYG